MSDLYECPFCHKKKAWVSSTYPSLVVHNCRGFLEEVGTLVASNNSKLKHKVFKPYSKPVVNSKFTVKEILSEQTLREYFHELELDTIDDFKVAMVHSYPGFWESMWEYECFKVVNEHNKLQYLLFFNNYTTIRPHAHCCLGKRGVKPTRDEALEILRATKDSKLQVKDLVSSAHFMTQKLPVH